MGATRHLFQDVMATHEIDSAGSEGVEGMIVDNIKPQTIFASSPLATG